AFFFEPPLPHPDLHSFPTRRSSDLPCSSAVSRVCTDRRRKTSVTRRRTVSRRSKSSSLTCSCCSCSARGTARTLSASSRSRAPRSEEHTSELQSQSNLVCRLLLEKK